MEPRDVLVLVGAHALEPFAQNGNFSGAVARYGHVARAQAEPIRVPREPLDGAALAVVIFLACPIP